MTDIAGILGQEYCESSWDLCDHLGRCQPFFQGHGQGESLEETSESPQFQDTFRRLDRSWALDDHLQGQLEKFTCLMYEYPTLQNIDTVRAPMLKKMVCREEQLISSSRVELSKLPPCRLSLISHIRRVKFCLCQWNHSHKNMLEIPAEVSEGPMSVAAVTSKTTCSC